MSVLRVYYSERYAPDDSPHLSRLAATAKSLTSIPGIEFKDPGLLDQSSLDGFHCPRYLSSFLSGTEPLASTQGIPWSPAVRDSALAMLAGQLHGAQHAMDFGIAMNLARGFHHAVFERGSGYCALNGLAFIAHRFPDKKVFVLDCDEHGGNGTEEYTRRLPNLVNFSIFGTRFGCYGDKASTAMQVRVGRQGFQAYHAALDQARQAIISEQPDIILYQAGADSHRDDPKNQSGLGTTEMYRRDKFIFALARELRIPILFVVAGGYQSADKVARLNTNTVRACLEIFQNGHRHC